MATKFEGSKYKLIYVFGINDQFHNDCVKIGEATISENLDTDQVLKIRPDASILKKYANARINQYTQTAGVAFQLQYSETAVYEKDGMIEGFTDHKVHDVLLRSGIKRKEFSGVNRQGTEWFITDVETAKKAIKAVKEGKNSLSANEVTEGQSPILFRPEQRDAIDKTKKKITKGNQMLWNAKMRFGKTLSALQVVKEMEFSHTLILTHRPVVDEGWYEDFNKIFYDTKDYIYGSKSKGEVLANVINNEEKKIIYFASMQDLRGSETVGGKYDKNHIVFKTSWDLIIVDEAHEGTQTELGKAVMTELTKPKTKVLRLSGTPFNLFDDFKEDEIYTWDYVMEQKAKAQWDKEHFGDPNPYSGLPKINIYIYDLGKLLTEYEDENIAFNFREFFRVDENDRFIHEKDILAFLNLLTKEDEDNLYPFANEKFRAIFNHTLWVLPGVKAASALSQMLKEHKVFGTFNIVNVAGNGDEDEENTDALNMVNKAIGKNPAETRTITLTCGRLTTGVTVKAWMGVLMLSGSYSTAASAYMQTIFRVQSPATINGQVKEDCYVFDFAPDRTLQVLTTVSRVSTKAGKTTEEQKSALREFLNFCPVIATYGSRMNEMKAESIIERLKRVYVEKVVRSGFDDGHLYNDELLKLSELDLTNFIKLEGLIKKIPALSNVGNIEINNQGLTKEEYSEMNNLEKKKKKKAELSEEERKRLEELREAKKARANAISILRAISIRMPLLIYGADIKDENKELTIGNFDELIDSQSWEEFMPRGVTKDLFNNFKKYYDPEIFSAAGKRIRAMARAADKLSIEERIERITDIFSTFRNPDKETVLTPWRVVNMHMGDTLGGYCFFEEGYNERLEEPRYIDMGNITNEVFSPDSYLLEINSKSGLYPLYLTYNIYRRRLKDLMFSPNTLEEHLELWDEAVAKNIFVICKTPMAKSITRRTLVGFRNVKVNTRYFEDLINQIKNKPDNFTTKVVRGKSYWKANNNDNMKFNAVVGNPPYQEVVAQKETNNGQKRSSSIFHYFQIISDKLGKYTSLIYPGARWIHRSGKGLEQFGFKQINDTHLSLLIFFPDSTDVFQEVGIPDGLSVVMKDMSKVDHGFKYIYSKSGENMYVYAENPGNDLFTLQPRDKEIVKRLDNIISQYTCLHGSILSQKLFSIESDFVEKNPNLVREYNDGDLYDPNKEIKLFTNDKAGKSGRSRWYVVSKNVITTGQQYLNQWKVIVSSANAGGQKRSNQIAIIDNHSAFGRSRVALKTFDTKKEAENFFKYATSEIIRFAFLLTDESLTSLAYKVPDLLDYSDSNGIIDYSKDVNNQLYKLFNIEEKEQLYIKEVLSSKPQ